MTGEFPVKSNRVDFFIRSLLLFAVGFFALVCWLPASMADDLVVTTSSGKVRGISRRGGGAEFLGIPYALPPVGEFRWREPQPVAPWKDVRDATSFGAPCSQAVLGDWNRHDAETSKEDCLFLNV